MPMLSSNLEEPTPTVAADVHEQILERLRELYLELYAHNGFGQLRLEMRFLKRSQKEVLINCGKEYRYVVDYVCKDSE